jgi:hypothetical protein
VNDPATGEAELREYYKRNILIDEVQLASTRRTISDAVVRIDAAARTIRRIQERKIG